MFLLLLDFLLLDDLFKAESWDLSSALFNESFVIVEAENSFLSTSNSW